MSFYVYENWAAKDKAVIHRGTCGYCNEGRGCQKNPLGNKNGQWHGSLDSFAKAIKAAKNTARTVWLDEINERKPFYHYFDYVFNSFKIKKGKRDPYVFRDVCSLMGLKPEEALFVDDNMGHTKRSSGEGLNAILFKSMDNFVEEMNKFSISLT